MIHFLMKIFQGCPDLFEYRFNWSKEDKYQIYDSRNKNEDKNGG